MGKYDRHLVTSIEESQVPMMEEQFHGPVKPGVREGDIPHQKGDIPHQTHFASTVGVSKAYW